MVDCPPLPEPVYVDAEMWEKIVLNLVSNAFKFTLEGRIEVTVRQSGRHAELVVRDTGVGIPADQMPRLFERFHRVEGVTGRTQEGSGIGLALVRELVRLHGGEVDAESLAGKGTSFVVKVPLGTVHLQGLRIAPATALNSTALRTDHYVEEASRWLPDADPAGGEATASVGTPPPEPGAGLPVSGERPRILLAEDNADMRQYLQRLLSEHYDVKAVSDGFAALEAVKRSRPDLILTDVMMPRLDGFGLLREIRADEGLCAMPVILLSARAGEESRVEGMQAVADDYLVKPFGARELLARVSAHLQMARLRKEADRRKDEFLATLAHELRNPLAPIRNALQIIEIASGDPQADRRGPHTDGAAGHAHGPADRRPAGREPHHPRQDRTAQGADRTGGGRPGRRRDQPPADRRLRPRTDRHAAGPTPSSSTPTRPGWPRCSRTC